MQYPTLSLKYACLGLPGLYLTNTFSPIPSVIYSIFLCPIGIFPALIGILFIVIFSLMIYACPLTKNSTVTLLEPSLYLTLTIVPSVSLTHLLLNKNLNILTPPAIFLIKTLLLNNILPALPALFFYLPGVQNARERENCSSQE